MDVERSTAPSMIPAESNPPILASSLPAVPFVDVRRRRVRYEALRELLASLSRPDADVENGNDQEECTDASASTEDLQLADAIRQHLARRPGHHRRRTTSKGLSRSLHTRWKKSADQLVLQACVEVRTEVLVWHPSEHPERAECCSKLALSLAELYQYTSDSVMLDEAIHLQREVLAVRAAGHPERHVACTTLAGWLGVKAKETRDDAILLDAIELQREALAQQPDGHVGRYRACNNLAGLLWTQFNGTGDGATLDEVMKLQRETYALQAAGDRERHHVCSNLAASLLARFHQTGDEFLLLEAIQRDREALNLRPAGHPYRHISCRNLAISLSTRFQQTKDDKLLNESIQLEREALSLCPMGHPDWQVSCQNLATSLRKRFHRTGDGSVIEEAIKLARELLALLQTSHPDRHLSCLTLALCLTERLPKRIGDTVLHNEISSLLEEALMLCPPGHPQLWRSFAVRAQISLQVHDYASAISDLQSMLSSPTHHVSDLLRAFVITTQEITFDDILRGHQEALLALYETALDLVTVITGYALDRRSQLQGVSDCTTLGPRAFLLGSRTDRLALGVQLLERARGVIWSQMLHMQNPDVNRVPADLSNTLQEILCRIDRHGGGTALEDTSSTQPSFLSDRDMQHEQRSQLQQVLRDIRAVPGLDDYMRGPDHQAFLRASARSAVVVLVADAHECRALIMPSPEAQPIDILLSISIEELQNLTHRSFTEDMHGSKSGWVGQESGRALTKISKRKPASIVTLAKIWHAIVKPIITRLKLPKQQGRRRPRIHWCPTGAFAFVPVHAAGIYDSSNDECCADYVVSSYTPTLVALLQAQQRPRVYAVPKMQVTTIAVARAHDVALPRLRFVTRECQDVADIACGAGAIIKSMDQSDTNDKVIDALTVADIVHFSCHGIQDSAQPHESRFCLGRGNLTVADLIEIKLQDAFLAFLSACETAKGAREHADEAVHLAASMLFAGFKSVVATMWVMGDEDGPHITRRFYEQLFAAETIDADAVPYALEEAVAVLRLSGAPPERWATFIHMGA